ncbi:unnamed protein product [Meloidogyne enterolobii]|uniref:Uncharacterized protein n=1 Tax=Meloidogyne enterolobii TaxID=390850 RepID=A0ACB1A9J5_MELEN
MFEQVRQRRNSSRGMYFILVSFHNILLFEVLFAITFLIAAFLLNQRSFSPLSLFSTFTFFSPLSLFSTFAFFSSIISITSGFASSFLTKFGEAGLDMFFFNFALKMKE